MNTVLNSGIYALIFDNQYFYIGQAIDLEARLSQHFRNFVKEKSSEKLITAFRMFGHPEARIVARCLPEYLDLMEAVTIHCNINNLGSDKCLNTVIPKVPDGLVKNHWRDGYKVTDPGLEPWMISQPMLEHFDELRRLRDIKKQIHWKKEKLLELAESEEISRLKDRIRSLELDLESERLSWWEKILKRYKYRVRI